ncbi:MAG: ABC transporter ATP-binding protein [Firmicutes bacterium]|nr:ABC transporter ATP-binding protein [Bacillota bacterium]
MISADKLCKRFGSVQAIKDVSFEVEKGEIVGFLGSNAAGKTTTMRILTCYFPPTSGSATVAGFDVFKDSLKVRQNIGYLPENVPLYTDMPVEYFLDFIASLKGIPGKERDAKVQSAIDRCGLGEVAEKPIGFLSKGYRQRVGIAQAIITDPPVLILDEPTVGLDPKQIIEIRNLIKSFGGKSTVILSTHILHEIEKVCDRILLIDRGQILAFDTLPNLAEKLQERYDFSLTVTGSTEKIKAVLKGIDGVDKLQETGKSDKGIYHYRMKIAKSKSVREAISAKLTADGFQILEMHIEKMSAEDIFRAMVPDREKSAKDQTEEKPKEGEAK